MLCNTVRVRDSRNVGDSSSIAHVSNSKVRLGTAKDEHNTDRHRRAIQITTITVSNYTWFNILERRSDGHVLCAIMINFLLITKL
jgi:hypothetical protein